MKADNIPIKYINKEKNEIIIEKDYDDKIKQYDKEK